MSSLERSLNVWTLTAFHFLQWNVQLFPEFDHKVDCVMLVDDFCQWVTIEQDHTQEVMFPLENEYKVMTASPSENISLSNYPWIIVPVKTSESSAGTLYRWTLYPLAKDSEPNVYSFFSRFVFDRIIDRGWQFCLTLDHTLPVAGTGTTLLDGTAVVLLECVENNTYQMWIFNSTLILNNFTLNI